MAEPKTNLRVAISGDLADIKSALVKLDSQLGGVGKTGARAGAEASRGLAGIGSQAGKLRGLLAGITVGALFKGILDNTRESEAAIAQLNAGLKSTKGIAGVTADEISKLADSLAATTTFGDDAIVSMASVLATFTNIRTTVFKDAIPAILDLSTRLGTDLNSAAIQVGKALNDPLKGITALAKAGVTFTEEQKKTIEGMMKLGDVAGAQRVILKELSTQMGGSAAAAADTLAGSIDQAQNAFGNLLEGDSSSGGLKDAKTAFQDLTKTLNDPKVKEGFAAIISGLGSLIKYAAQAAGAVGGLLEKVNQAGLANAQKSYDGLLDQREKLLKTIADGGRLPKDRDPLAALLGITNSAAVEKAKTELREVNALLAQQQAILQGRGPKAAPAAPAPAAPYQAAPMVDQDALDRAAAEAKRKLEQLRKEREKLLEESKKADAERVKDLLELEAKVSAGMVDIEIALKRATGDEAGAAFDEIRQKYAQLIADLKASGREGSVAIVERLISLEQVDAQLAAFKQKMADATAASNATIGSLSAQASGGLINPGEADQGRADALARELVIQQQLLATAQKYLATLAADSPEAAKTLQFIEQLNGRIGEVQATQNQFMADVKNQATNALTGFFTDLASGAKSFKDAFLDMVRNFVAGIAQMIAQKLALKAVDAIFSAFHTGGLVGAGGGSPRSGINPMVFGLAPRYHSGGIAGLAPNEVPAILQRGEEVLSKNSPRHRQNIGAGGAAPRSKTVILFDESAVANHMQTSAGEQATLVNISRNAGAVRELLGL